MLPPPPPSPFSVSRQLSNFLLALLLKISFRVTQIVSRSDFTIPETIRFEGTALGRDLKNHNRPLSFFTTRRQKRFHRKSFGGGNETEKNVFWFLNSFIRAAEKVSRYLKVIVQILMTALKLWGSTKILTSINNAENISQSFSFYLSLY